MKFLKQFEFPEQFDGENFILNLMKDTRKENLECLKKRETRLDDFFRVRENILKETQKKRSYYFE